MSTGNGNFFGLNVPNLNFGDGNMGGAGFSLPGATNQIQQNMAQAFSPEALYKAQFNNGFGGIGGGGKQPGGWLEGLDFGLEDLASGAGIINGIGSTLLGMKSYGLAKDSFNLNKAAALKNYENKAKLANRSIAATARKNAAGRGLSEEESIAASLGRYGLDEDMGAV